MCNCWPRWKMYEQCNKLCNSLFLQQTHSSSFHYLIILLFLRQTHSSSFLYLIISSTEHSSSFHYLIFKIISSTNTLFLIPLPHYFLNKYILPNSTISLFLMSLHLTLFISFLLSLCALFSKLLIASVFSCRRVTGKAIPDPPHSIFSQPLHFDFWQGLHI